MYKLNQILTAAAFALFTGIAAVSGSAVASTPDGETPANEGVCDVLHGGTSGLYGLCVAYCEAQDLDAFEKEPPRTKILDNYNKKRQAGDLDMPCMQVPCPCWTSEELASIPTDSKFCESGTNKLKISSTVDPSIRHLAEANTTLDRGRCRYRDENIAPTTSRSFRITNEEAQACYLQVNQACK